MISDIKVDFSIIKSVLNSIIEKNKSIINSDEEIVLNELYKNYTSKSMINKNILSEHKNQFRDFYSDKCKKLSIYCADDLNNSKRTIINKLENEGKLFSSSIFVDFIKQLVIENKLLSENNTKAISIAKCLYEHLGNSLFYPMDNTVLCSLFQNAIFLFLSETNHQSFPNTETIEIINSMKRLQNKYKLDYEIKNGEILLSDDTDKTIQKGLEKSIAMIGGINFLKTLFSQEIFPKYNPTIDRFLIYRNKYHFLSKSFELRIPYNYLIQLGIKHIIVTPSPLLTISGIKNEINFIIQNSRDYLNVLDLQSYSIFSNLFLNYKMIPSYLSKNIAFEKMHNPTQYRPDFVIMFLKNVYHPLFINTKNLNYCFDEYLRFCQTILYDKKFCATYTFDELKQKTKLDKKTLNNILYDVSYNYNEVNCMFESFLSETNYYKRPLVKLKDNTFFLLSAYFNGFAFCEAIYSKLKTVYPKSIDRDKGYKIEDMIKSFFDRKEYPYHCGKYRISKSEINECDLVVEGEKSIIFYEIKNRPLPNTFEQGDDVKTLNCLAEGMINAQIQCLKHKYYLEKRGTLLLEKDNENNKTTSYKLNLKGRRIICISVCAQEYLFLTNKLFSETLLKSLLIADYHTTDSAREKELNKLKKSISKLRNFINEIKEYKSNINQVFFDTLFRSAQQLYTILEVSESLDNFIDVLTEPIYIIDSSDDVYCQLLRNYKK